MKFSEHLSKYVIALLIAASFGLAGCDEGPFEEAGEDVDDAVEEVEEETEDAADEIEDEVDG